jgi:hypothetical protein
MTSTTASEGDWAIVDVAAAATRTRTAVANGLI